jgi:predicted nuclease of predicted toxin-antitoxin system
VLIIDECLSTKLAKELRERGRPSESLAALRLRGQSDPEVIAAIAEYPQPCVVVTADAGMPLDWADEIARAGTTIAVIDSRHGDDYLIAEWYRDVAHRWAHVMRSQPSGSVHRYTASGHREWRPRRATSR